MIIKKLHHPIYFVATLFLGITLGYRSYEWRHYGNSEVILLITALTIMIVSMLKDRLFETTAVRTLEDIKENSEKSWRSLTEWVTTHLSPTIISLHAREEVLKEATDLISTVITEPSKSNRFIVYIGSGDLLKDPPHDEEGSTPLTEYQSVIARVKNDAVEVTRYISLLDKSDYHKRIPATQAAYKKWLIKQISLLEVNPNYTFYDCPRAPKWGSSRSSIFTQRALLDVVGNGQSGVLIRGEQVAQELLEGSKELFEDAGVKPSVYESSRLQAYLDNLEESVSVSRSRVRRARAS